MSSGITKSKKVRTKRDQVIVKSLLTIKHNLDKKRGEKNNDEEKEEEEGDEDVAAMDLS